MFTQITQNMHVWCVTHSLAIQAYINTHTRTG